jgi:hypothetical protein
MTDFHEHCSEILVAIKLKHFVKSALQILGFKKTTAACKQGAYFSETTTFTILGSIMPVSMCVLAGLRV